MVQTSWHPPSFHDWPGGRWLSGRLRPTWDSQNWSFETKQKLGMPWDKHNLCMYVYIYACGIRIYIYIYTYIHVGYIFIYIYTYTYGMCMYNYIYTHIIHMGYILKYVICPNVWSAPKMMRKHWIRGCPHITREPLGDWRTKTYSSTIQWQDNTKNWGINWGIFLGILEDSTIKKQSTSAARQLLELRNLPHHSLGCVSRITHQSTPVNSINLPAPD